MPRYVYRDIDGKIKPVEVSERPPLNGTPDIAAMPFQEAILSAYSRLEDSGKWQGAYASKSETKRIHELARDRDAALTR